MRIRHDNVRWLPWNFTVCLQMMSPTAPLQILGAVVVVVLVLVMDVQRPDCPANNALFLMMTCCDCAVVNWLGFASQESKHGIPDRI